MKKYMRSLAMMAVTALLVLPVFAGGSKDSAPAENSITLESGKLKIGTEIGYPPFEYFDTDGKTPIGFDVAMGKALGEKLGLEVEFVDTAWDGIFAGIDTKKYDCIISAVTITPERSAKYLFSDPYIGNGQSMVLNKNADIKATTPEDLTGLKVGYQAETTSDIYMTKLAEGGLKFTPCEYDKILNAFDDLKFKRCDAVIADSVVAIDYVSKKDSPYVMAWRGKADEYFGICMSKENPDLQAAVNKALGEMFADGTMKKISEKFFGMDMVSSLKK